MLSRKGGGQGQPVPGHLLPTMKLLNLEMCALLVGQQNSPHTTQHCTEGPDTRLGIIVVAEEKVVQ